MLRVFIALLSILSCTFVNTSGLRNSKGLKIKDSCFNIMLTNSTLKAICKNKAGEFTETEILLDECLANFNGKLLWTDNPLGFYSDDCQDCKLNNTLLKCNCKKTDNSANDAAMDVNEGVANDNGNLKCLYDI